MQRSSNSIGSLAAALAKAQGELVNPEKSLVATIREDGPGATERTFRYASLSSGLDIVRKVLGQYEIATVQTTSVDQAAGLINLTTVLAHASGEWIASDWPVCAISETATPQRMGAALTYARRYALFTLVGIAGEEDLDAPDLTTPTSRTSGSEKPQGKSNGRLSGGQHDAAQRAILRRDAKIQSQTTKTILGAEASAELRDQLIAELNDLVASDEAALWAYRCLREKNKLTTADAQRVEEAFQAKLVTIGVDVSDEQEPEPASRQSPRAEKLKKRSRSEPIDKSVLTLPEPRRIRDRNHVKSVGKQPCLICGRRPSDAHHLRFAQHPTLGRKVSDEFTVPLCRGHHREVHRCGDEAAWWSKAGIDPKATARTLWLETHPLAKGFERPGISDQTQHLG
jgi:ERF superfamily